MRSGSDFQWNNIDGRCFGIDFQNSIAWRNRFGLHSFLLYSVASTQLLKILGETGNNVMMRLMGLILMVIAVECFISGIRPVLIEILKQAHACS